MISPLSRFRPTAPTASLLLAAFVLLAAGCASSPMSRIDAHRSVYESWPVEMQEAVLHQRAIPGMTPAMVEMALGRPTEVQSRIGSNGDSEEVWIYRKSSARLPAILENASVSVGTGVNVGGVGVGVGTSAPVRRGSSRGRADEDQEVVIRNGIVVRGSS